jgi:hypothetical protein
MLKTINILSFLCGKQSFVVNCIQWIEYSYIFEPVYSLLFPLLLGYFFQKNFNRRHNHRPERQKNIENNSKKCKNYKNDIKKTLKCNIKSSRSCRLISAHSKHLIVIFFHIRSNVTSDTGTFLILFLY